MSSNLKGGVRSHASNPLPYSFNSANVLKANAEEHSLGGLIDALASNDPAQVARIGGDLESVLRDTESMMRVLGDCQRLKHEHSGDIAVSTCADEHVVVYMAAALIGLCASAIPALEDAVAVTNGGRHE